MKYPTPQTPQEMEEEVLQSIRRVAWDMIRAIDAHNISALDIHHDFLESQWQRRKTIITTIQQKPIRF